jgi:hypothetical protein
MMFDTDTVGSGLGSRLVDVLVAMERHEAFVFGGDNRPATASSDGGVVARDFVLRALSTMADSVNYRIMLRLAEADAPLGDLCGHVGLGRAAVWERVNDLVQAGLVGRELERDLVGLSGPGQELLKFVEAVTSAAQARADTASSP